MVTNLHKTPSIFLKLDIQKAFDILNWSYLLDILQALGFRPSWREWISILIATSS
jgi:mannosylglycoprotein endo-beta-mannosidase